MAQKTIVDRVLMLAAAVCASALAWQLTVLLTSKGHGSAPARAAAAATVQPAAAAPQPAAAASAAAASAPAQTVRVVYPGPDTVEKTTVKASDPPVASPLAAERSASALTPAVRGAAASPPSSAPLSLVSDSSQTPPSGLQAAIPAQGDAERTDTGGEGASAPIALASAEQPAPADTPDPAAKSAPDGAIDLNHASLETLNHLKGVGRIGQAIVSHRPYRSVEDLVKKRVLRRDVYEQIRQQVVTTQ